MVQKFDISGMTCAACQAVVEKSVRKLSGINSVNVSLLSNSMTVDFDENKTSVYEIIQAVNSAGYRASVPGEGKEKAASGSDEIKEMKTRLIISFVFMVPLLYITMFHMLGAPLPPFLHGVENSFALAFLQFLLTLPIMYVNRKYFTSGFKTLFHLAPNMDSLIAVGTSAAVIYGIFAIFKIGYGLGHGDLEMAKHYSMDLYFESAGVILALITLGKFLESRAKGKTKDAISKLMDLSPKLAIVERDGNEITVGADEVKIGDIVIVKPGASIPVDGVIVEGSSSIDQSALTGESIPVEKSVGDHVIAATINKSGYFKFRAEKVGSDTVFSQIIRLVEEAANSKAPIAKLADKISGIFVPAVILIAAISTITWLILGKSLEFSLSIGISVLVISCPCALGLATPVAIMVGTGLGATNGILIKSAESLENAHDINTVVLDKTGTLTQGKPVVTDVFSNGIGKDDLIQIAASIESKSEHPLAQAVCEYAKQNGVDFLQTQDFNAVFGKGIYAKINDVPYYAGNELFMKENGIDVSSVKNEADKFSAEGKTPLYFAGGGKVLGIIAVADVLKPTSIEAVKGFRKLGIDCLMLTGDNEKTARAIAQKLDLTDFVSEVLPQDKESVIRKLQEEGKKVAMVGDGINDAPALARSDVGIAIGNGVDIAIESADIVLMKSDLNDAVKAVKLSRATLKNIKQNLFWAFFYNIIGIPIAAGVFYEAFGLKLNPMFAAAAMSLSSVFVVTNALRLKRAKLDK